LLPPINIIRPGQSDLSFINARQKALNFVQRIEDRRNGLGDPSSLFGDEEALTAVVGPGGKYLVLIDGHHHIAALKAVEHVVNEIIGDSTRRSPTTRALDVAKEIKMVQHLFGGPGGIPDVPIVIK